MLAIAVLTGLTCFIFASQIKFLSLDLGRHLKNGELVFGDSDVLYKNTYSYTMPDEPFINHHWLSGAVYFAVQKMAGFGGLAFLNILLALSAIGLLMLIASRTAGFWIMAACAVLPIMMLGERVDVRPEMFSYFFIALFIYLICRHEASGKKAYLYSLPALQAIWVNLHIYFFMGPFLLGIYAFSKAIGLDKIDPKKPLAVNLKQYKNGALSNLKSALSPFYALVGTGLACFINPNFFKGAVYPLLIMKDYGYTIAENMSPWFMENVQINYNIAIFKILLVLLAASYLTAIYARSKRFDYLDIFLLFAIFLSLRAIRNFPVFALGSILVLPVNLKFLANYKLAAKYILPGAFFILGGWSLLFCATDYSGGRWFIKHPRSLNIEKNYDDYAEFFRQNLHGPIFNNYDLGSALIYQLYPQEKVFVDNRPEAYGAQFFSTVYKPMMEDEQAWEKYSQQYGINTAIISHTDATPWARSFIARMIKDPDWPLVYLDRQVMIMAKKSSGNSDVIEKFAYKQETLREKMKILASDADLYSKFNLSSLAGAAGEKELAREIIQSILDNNPADGRALAQMGYYQLAEGRKESLVVSNAYFDKAIDSGYRLPAVYIQRGVNYFYLGDASKARKDWEKALSLDKNDDTAKGYIDQLDDLDF